MAQEKRIIADFPYKVDVTENIWIPLGDGTRLSARLWMPRTEEKVPAVLEYIPYRKNDGTRMRDEPMHGYISGHGYAVVRVDMRGSGESDGLLEDEYLKQEQDDALEVIDWISRQDWCTGDVGMMGKSWGGFNSLQVAARRPPALRAIITVGFTDDRYNQDIHYKGGCLLNDNFWWGSIMMAYQVRPAEKEIVGDDWREQWLNRLSHMPLWMKLWMDHPVRDDYWKHGSVCEDYRAIDVPVLAIDGWEDAYTNTVLTLMEGLDVPARAIIGPWAHVYAHDGVPAPAMNFLGEAVRWWDHWLKGIENGAMDGPKIRVWLEDYIRPEAVRPKTTGRWVGLYDWPDPSVVMKPYRIRGRSLIPEEEAGKADGRSAVIRMCTPQNHGLLSGEWMGAGVLGESAPDQRMDDGMAEVFETEPLEEDLDLVGYPEVSIDLCSDKEKALLFVQLSDVSPEGDAERVSYGILNLTHREGHDHVKLLVPGEKIHVSVRLDCCGHRFPRGHRLRISAASTFWPMFWNMPEAAVLELDPDSAKVSLPVYRGAECPGPDMDAQSAPPTPHTILQEGRVDRSISYDILTDTWTCITDGVGGVFGEGIYRFDDIDLTVEHNLKRELVLSNKDPLSAAYTITQKMKLGREGWIIDADIITRQTGDLENFYLYARMDVRENGEIAFSKEWNEAVPRIGL